MFVVNFRAVYDVPDEHLRTERARGSPRARSVRKTVFNYGGWPLVANVFTCSSSSLELPVVIVCDAIC
jgi:hypothetical protein